MAFYYLNFWRFSKDKKCASSEYTDGGKRSAVTAIQLASYKFSYERYRSINRTKCHRKWRNESV